jgi:hypothetical protein
MMKVILFQKIIANKFGEARYCSYIHGVELRKIKVMTKTERKKQQTKEIIELLEKKFNATDFDNDAGSYFTFIVNGFEGSLMRRDFKVMMHDNIKMGSGFTDEEYEKRDTAVYLEYAINKAISNYLDMPGFKGTTNQLKNLSIFK